MRTCTEVTGHLGSAKPGYNIQSIIVRMYIFHCKRERIPRHDINIACHNNPSIIPHVLLRHTKKTLIILDGDKVPRQQIKYTSEEERH